MTNLFKYMAFDLQSLPIRYNREHGYYLMAERFSGLGKITAFWHFFDSNADRIHEIFGDRVTVKRNAKFHTWTWYSHAQVYLYDANKLEV